MTMTPDTVREAPQGNSNSERWGPVDKGIGKSLIKTPIFEKDMKSIHSTHIEPLPFAKSLGAGDTVMTKT